MLGLETGMSPALSPPTSTHTRDGALISIWPKRQIFADSCSSQPIHLPHNQPTSFCHKPPSKPLGKSQWILESHSLGPLSSLPQVNLALV